MAEPWIIEVAATNECQQLAGFCVFYASSAITKSSVGGAVDIAAVTVGHFTAEQIIHIGFKLILDSQIKRGIYFQPAVAYNGLTELLFELIAHHQYKMGRFNVVKLIGQWLYFAYDIDSFGFFRLCFCDVFQ